MMHSSWSTTLLRLFFLGAAGLAIGWFYNVPAVGLLIAALLALGWHLYWLYRLDRWIHGKKIDFLPDGSGVWPRIFGRVSFFRARAKRRGKRFKALIKNLRQATKAFPDGGIILNQANEILVCNKVAEELLGIERKRDRGMRLENLVRHPRLKEYLAGGIGGEPIEIPSPMNGGRWLSIHSVPYGFDQSLLLIRDVTERRQTDKLRRDFVANASHELRTPLTVLTGYLDVLADDQSVGADLVAPLKDMRKQAQRMQLLVEDLLRLSELEAKSFDFSGELLDVEQMARAACNEIRELDAYPERMRVVAHSQKRLLGDPRDLQSIIGNLLANAIRATQKDDEIEISWSTDAEGGYLVVKDAGEGIAAEHLPRLTERFYRVENGRQRNGDKGGTGLGLAIVKHAVLRHGGNLEVSSELGVGSRFECHFPIERIH